MGSFELGKSMRKSGLAKLVAVEVDLAGRSGRLQEVIVDAPTDFPFIGQQYEEKLGLYIYSLGWYDPYVPRLPVTHEGG